MPYGITQCYLPPAKVAFLPLLQPKMVLDLATTKIYKAELIGTAVRCSPCPRLLIAVAIVINTAVRGDIRTWVVSHGSRTR